VGREETLEQLETLFFVQNENRKIAIAGLGGIGKTQVALKFVYWVRENKSEYSTFWVSALSRASFEQTYTEMGRKLPIQRGSEDEDPKESVRRYLSSEAAGPWLLVVDNADDMDVLFGSSDALGGINKYLPEREGGLILFTTRFREVAMSVAGINVVELQDMTPQEAVSLLERSLIRREPLQDSVIATELLRELAHHPLAITQAAAYLNRNQVSIAKYLGLLKGPERDLVSLMSREFRDSTQHDSSQKAVATTWLVSIDQIRKIDPAAVDLLSFMSQIEWKAIPESLLPRLESEEQMLHAIGTLSGYAFVSKRDKNLLDMHRLVHVATRIWVIREGYGPQVIERAVRHLAESFPSINFENRETWREYLPHAFRLLQRDEAGDDMEERYQLYFWVGRCLQVDGRIKDAVRCLEKCTQWWESLFPEDHPLLLESQSALGAAYRADGQTKKAVNLLEHVVAVREETPTEDHVLLLASQHELARAYGAAGRTQDAITLLERVVTIKKGIFAEHHPSLLASQHELAGAYRDNGQTKKAVEHLQHVVAVRERTLAEDHPFRLTSQHALAGAYLSNRQVQEAVDLLKYVVAVRQRTLAENHPSLLVSQRALLHALETASQHSP